MKYMTDRKRAQGLGSARGGTQHHWHMMVSSIALVIVLPVFIITFGIGLGGSHEEVMAYYSRPFPALVMAITLLVVVNHTMNEAVEAVEDYVHGTAQKLALVAVRCFAYLLILVGLFAVARLAL
ncbi:succinate dehydrogenase, hydrophobic membrane anchor protein [Mangrovicoccus algicola]|uniref:Succinate dehydrogenase, hydrophobic membrane anchor protein n=1 Tax=Mangrovicoccus algicola TaxID=2771008 RepID=A0A8J6Z3C2_9RHOB|nr:succinate dehydrogenase, hydrophobic membrane anchor protein [Mangrovicoccus algicola]MBE3636684.1 succinate dehydrogenase, hydrophobic membrane anchor protein [Mangrovicoccus algicola]